MNLRLASVTGESDDPGPSDTDHSHSLTSANSVGKRRLFLGILLERREEVGRRTETATVQIHFQAGEEVWKRFGRGSEEDFSKRTDWPNKTDCLSHFLTPTLSSGLCLRS